MDWESVYPGGRAKALTFSYDDGQVYDRRLVEIFNRYGMKATFHLNSGILDTPGFVSSSEVAALYRGHEVACHGVRHEWLTQLSSERVISEIWEDRRALERLVGYPVRGFSYAYGVFSDRVADALSALGVEYARTTKTSEKSFAVPVNTMFWHPTAHHGGDIAALADAFFELPHFCKLPLLYIWGHSFEFERENNWHIIERFCEKTRDRADIWYATNLEYIRYLNAVRGLICSAEGNIIHNPHGLTVWLRTGQDLIALLPGDTLTL